MILVNLTQADEIVSARVGLERVETSRLKGMKTHTPFQLPQIILGM